MKEKLETEGRFFLNGKEYVLVRTHYGEGGTYVGFLENRKGEEVTLRKARKLRYWNEKASPATIAAKGVMVRGCDFSCEVERIIILRAKEIISSTEKAKESFDQAAIWTELDKE